MRAQQWRAAWSRLPVVVRAVASGMIVLEIGSGLSVLPLLGNLKFHPEIPWALPVTCLVLAAFWAFFSGHGLSRIAPEARRIRSRSGPVPAQIWLAALPAIASGTMMLVALRLVAPSLMPVAAPSVAISLSSYPLITVAGALIAIALSAAVVEETAFRGYVQQPIEARHGVLPAILVTGVLFWVEHLDKVTVTHLPGHLAASAVFGLLAWFTRSLKPAMVAHAAADLLLQPAYLSRSPPFVWTALSARPVWEGGTTNLLEKLERIGRALSPANLLTPGPDRIVAILGWAFGFSLVATVLALRHLARAAPPR